MGKRIIKKIGGERIGSGAKMTVQAQGYGYSTHDVSKIRRTSISFGTIVPMGQFLMPSGSRLRIELDALITSNALLYQLYGSAKFQVDVFSVRMALYNPKMLLNLNDQGYNISDIKFPSMTLTTKAPGVEADKLNTKQVNPSALLRYLGIAGNGTNEANLNTEVTRKYNAMWLLMYYQTVKEYYCNKQEKVGMMIHNIAGASNIKVTEVELYDNGVFFGFLPESGASLTFGNANWSMKVNYDTIDNEELLAENFIFDTDLGGLKAGDIFGVISTTNISATKKVLNLSVLDPSGFGLYYGWNEVQYSDSTVTTPSLQEWDLKAVDRMQMRIMANVENIAPVEIDNLTEFPYGASFKKYGDWRSINGSQEGICLGTYQSDVFNNWLDNATVNALNAKNKVKVDANGEFSIDMLNITQKLYNYDMRIGITDGTLEEWRELTYGQKAVGKSLKPVYEGGLTKEIVFDQIVSTASTADEPLGSIASRGQFGSKHKGGYVQIEGDEEKLVMVLAKITPRIVYNQGNDWTVNLKTLEDLHKPALDKIGYQNLLTDTMGVFDTVVKGDGSLITRSAGKQPAWQWYRTNYDDALGNMADTEDYKVFGRSYEYERDDDQYRIKDLTTYIDPMKYNDVFALASLDAQNFDLQLGMDAKMTLVMSEEVIPNL